jgi:endonuclease-3
MSRTPVSSLSTREGKRKLARMMERRLRARYGLPIRPRSLDPVDVLIQTILSQNTSDTNSHRAFKNLRERFSQWDDVIAARPVEVENAIRTGGLAKIKAHRIKNILSSIKSDWKTVSLRFLCAMPPEQAKAVLFGFKGVGPKTANCVLLFGCAMDVFPVDTHILRISKRVGLIHESVSLERAHALWADFLPPGLAYPLHINLIEHGRETCRARNPRCRECCLRSLCPFWLS